MKKNIELHAFYLDEHFSKSRVEASLGIIFKKGIEATYYAQMDDAIITYTPFNVLCTINCSRGQVISILEQLEIEEAKHFDKVGVYQDYPIRIDPELPKEFVIDNDEIVLKTNLLLNLLIITHVVSQSVALDLYEQKLADYYERSRDLIDNAGTYSIFKRAKLARFAKQLVLIRHDMVIDLHLLDKPDIVWENEDAEALYNRLASILELKSRFEVVEYKLNSIKDDIIMVMDLTNHNHSSFLEWIIIVLIAVEIVMGLMEWFIPSITH